MLVESRLTYYEISPLLSQETAVFPGDTPFSRRVGFSIEKGDNYTLSSIHSTVHVGAHTDAPSHYHRDGSTIEHRALDSYLGPCQVISVELPLGERILPEHLAGKPIRAPRVLFKTRSFPNPDRWNSSFNSLSPGLIHFLAEKGVILVGIDTPSIDPAADNQLSSHQAVHECDLAILEGIVLDAVPEGTYRLIALPLRIQGGDASPVRAILLPPEATE